MAFVPAGVCINGMPHADACVERWIIGHTAALTKGTILKMMTTKTSCHQLYRNSAPCSILTYGVLKAAKTASSTLQSCEIYRVAPWHLWTVTTTGTRVTGFRKGNPRASVTTDANTVNWALGVSSNTTTGSILVHSYDTALSTCKVSILNCYGFGWTRD